MNDYDDIDDIQQQQVPEGRDPIKDTLVCGPIEGFCKRWSPASLYVDCTRCFSQGELRTIFNCQKAHTFDTFVGVDRMLTRKGFKWEMDDMDNIVLPVKPNIK